MRSAKRFFYWAVVITLVPFSAHAQKTDRFIEGAKLCTRSLTYTEQAHGIPMRLLTAISTTETGRSHKGLNMALPWPWTINVEGKGYFYDSKEDAIAAVRAFQARGARSIDVGCMQINLMYHPKAFNSLEEAFTPEHNVNYAAKFLLDLYKETGKNWDTAAASYHSRTYTRGQGYLKNVLSHQQRILRKIQAALSHVPVQSTDFSSPSNP